MDFKSPWWVKYRKRRYKTKNYLTFEVILRRSFRETVREYLSCASIAGIREINNPNNTFLHRLAFHFSLRYTIYCFPSALRIVLLFTSLVNIMYFLQYTWNSTLANPLVVTGESSTYPIKDIDFPAIAFCNINRISLKALKLHAAKMYPRLSKLNFSLAHLEFFYQNMGRLIDFSYDDTRLYAKLMDAFSLKEFSDMTVGLMRELAPNCEETLIKCQWAGKVVDCKNIFELRRTVLGHCCAFNYVLDYNAAVSLHATIAPVKRQTVPGVNNGLRVVMDAMIDDYAFPLTYRTGFEVLIFDPIHFADMTGGRVIQRMVQPNQEQFFQVESVKQIASPEVRKYPLSARKCLFRDENVKEFHNKYSYSACLVKCRKSLQKCTDLYVKNLRCLDKYREKLQYLYPLDTEDTEGLEQELVDSLYCPECLPDCELTQHSTKSYKIPLQTTRMRNGINLTDKCVISIFHPTTSGILHRLDVVAYWFEILSNIGGFSGMLMGIGIYTVYFLFVYTFCEILYSNYNKYR
ncbi:pickpocket protein 28-like [Trichoplusia ni]|uniref:Pickpocket protein 28-like n=1 Tax=Trichoplusia ni TaxID=7111 RepID=A0A7E5X0J5_TRINI|nr:pickpocket protein 28-like [Trichoplusia ni]